MRECATLFCKTKIDPYLYLERFIEVNKSFFVENAQVKFATLLLEADAAGGRDWNTWARDWGSWMKGGQGEMEKSRADVSYIYGQAMRHLNQLMGLISNNPEADDPKILNSLRMQLQSVSKTLTSIKPSIDTLAPKIMNVAFNKYKGINTPLAPSGDMASLKAVRDGQIFKTIADMIMKLNNPATNDADKGSIQTTLNSIKTRQIPFQNYNNIGTRNLQRVISWKASYWTTLTPDQQAVLIKFFGDETQAQLAFAKFKYFRGLTPASDVMVKGAQVTKAKAELDEMKIFAREFESWMAANQKQIIKNVIPGGLHTWKQTEGFFVKLQQDNRPFARILQQRGLLSPIIQLYTTMANWFDRNPTTGATQYDSLFGTTAAPTPQPKIKKQILAVIAGIYQKTVGNNAEFDKLKRDYP
jgi:hypothetical protein